MNFARTFMPNIFFSQDLLQSRMNFQRSFDLKPLTEVH
jgi:hypothetical protein